MASVNTRKHPNGLDYIEIDTPLCYGRIFLQGAQIDSFVPKGKAPLLWVSPADDYLPGSGIRGGIPVCWPWFGMHANEGWPQHGFARTRLWQLERTHISNERVELSFVLKLSDEDKDYWPHDTEVRLDFVLSDSLKVSLINRNLSEQNVTLTQALHSYFPIGDIHQLRATGFAGSQYIEFGEGPYAQVEDEVRFERETDRVYTGLSELQKLHTPNGTILVSREQSHSAVLWNPWIDKSKRLARFQEQDYLSMVCLEAANVLEDKLVLGPKQSHTLTTEIRWQE